MRTCPSVPSFNTNLILTFPLLGEMPSEVDLPTFVEFSVKSIISFLSLQTCTSAILSTSQQLCLGPVTVKMLDCQLSISDVGSVFVSFLALRFLCEPYIYIRLRAYFYLSFGCLIQQ